MEVESLTFPFSAGVSKAWHATHLARARRGMTRGAILGAAKAQFLSDS